MSLMRRVHAITTRLLLSCVLVVATERVRADDAACTAGDRACGHRAFERATAAFDKERYEEAIAWFVAAESAAPHPTITFNLGLSYARSNRPSLAHAQFTTLDADASIDPELRARVRRELAAVERRVARVSIESPRTGTTLEWDGRPADVMKGDLIVDPGTHHVRVSTANVPVLDQEIKLEPGERLKLSLLNRTRTLDIVVVDNEAKATPASDAGVSNDRLPALPQAPSPRETLSPKWFYLSGAATVLLGAATVWSGADVQGAYNRYEADLPWLTQAQADDRVADGHARELRTNVLLAATALSATATTLVGLLWVNWHREPTHGATTSFVVHPGVGGLRGSF